MIAPDLVRQAQHGDQQALGDLLAALRPALVRHCSAKVDRNDAEDVAQEALMRLVNALKVYQPVASIEAYAMRITTNTIASHYRDRSRGHVVPVANVPEPCAELDAEQHVLQAELSRELAGQVHGLHPRWRDIVLLRVVHGLSADETAQRLSSTPGAVRVAQHRALRQLRKSLVGAS